MIVKQERRARPAQIHRHNPEAPWEPLSFDRKSASCNLVPRARARFRNAAWPCQNEDLGERLRTYIVGAWKYLGREKDLKKVGRVREGETQAIPRASPLFLGLYIFPARATQAILVCTMGCQLCKHCLLCENFTSKHFLISHNTSVSSKDKRSTR